MEDSDDVRRIPGRGFAFPQAVDINNWYLGFNWLDPVVGKGDTPEQRGEEPQAAPGDLDRDRLGGAIRIFPAKGGVAAMARCRRASSVRASSRREASTGDAPRVNGQPVRRPSRMPGACSPEPATPTAATTPTGKPLVLNYDF